MKIFDMFLAKLGYIRVEQVKEQLNFARSVGKRLDEHREEVEEIHETTDYFEKGELWQVAHHATQDDYLMRLYHMVHGCWPIETEGMQPTGEYVRARPTILGECRLPEYVQFQKNGNHN